MPTRAQNIANYQATALASIGNLLTCPAATMKSALTTFMASMNSDGSTQVTDPALTAASTTLENGTSAIAAIEFIMSFR